MTDLIAVPEGKILAGKLTAGMDKTFDWTLARLEKALARLEKDLARLENALIGMGKALTWLGKAALGKALTGLEKTKTLAEWDLPAFVRTPLGGQIARTGLAALASAVAAMVICALLPSRSTSPVPSPDHQAGARAERIVPQASAGFDVAKVWTEERASIYATANPGTRVARADAWEPAGGMSILMGTRFPIAAPSGEDTRTAKAEPSVPLPLPSPLPRANDGRRQAAGRKAPAQRTPQVASLPPEAPEPGYFEFFRKLFGNPDHAAQAMLAANPKTVIYDIEKRVVYLPNGDKLEAHSGYGQWMDDPASVDRKNLGVTPPNVYAVSFREKLFHGVRALRLTPVGTGNMYGRDGMLAHSYMLGEDGQSNGCVSVRDYQRFLQAYEDGAFKQMIVVRSVEGSPAQVASVQSGSL